MKANEFRIGFYYNYKGVAIKMDSKALKDLLDIGGEYNYAPILLTEEWLLRFGDWIKSHDDGWVYGIFKGYSISNYHKEYWELEIGGSSDSDRNEHIKIYYVHQLQNIYFALTGEELE